MSELSTAREEKKKKDESFRYARQRCIEANANRTGPANKNCAMHFTGTYDRRISTEADRRQFRSVENNRPLRRNRYTGRRAGDITKYTDLPVQPLPVQPERLIKDRRASQSGRRRGGRRRVGPADRRVVNTWGAPARRHITRGRRAGDVSYNKLPRATRPPTVKTPAPKLTLRERVEGLDGYGFNTGYVRREKVLDLLREYGMGDH